MFSQESNPSKPIPKTTSSFAGNQETIVSATRSALSSRELEELDSRTISQNGSQFDAQAERQDPGKMILVDGKLCTPEHRKAKISRSTDTSTQLSGKRYKRVYGMRKDGYGRKIFLHRLEEGPDGIVGGWVEHCEDDEWPCDECYSPYGCCEAKRWIPVDYPSFDALHAIHYADEEVTGLQSGNVKVKKGREKYPLVQ